MSDIMMVFNIVQVELLFDCSLKKNLHLQLS